MSSFALFGWLCALFVVALLYCEKSERRIGIWIAKPLASSCFVVAALLSDPFHQRYSLLLLLAFFLSFCGDVLLIPKRKRFFLAGLGSFLLAHVCFAIAFLEYRSPGVLAGAALLLGVLALLAYRWLQPHLSSSMRLPVKVYIATIALMTTTAASFAASTRHWLALVGAVAFFLSDLAVARQRFVSPGFINKLWGLPLYYAAQFLFLSTLTGFIGSMGISYS